jgi:ferrous iron transport protein A
MGIGRARILTPAQDCDTNPINRILKSDQTSRIFLLPPRQRRSGVGQVSVLSDLNLGETGVVVALELPDTVQNHLMYMGFVPDSVVKALRRAPAGDPTVYSVDGMEIALRHETASAIRVRPPHAQPDGPANLSQTTDLIEVAR